MYSQKASNGAIAETWPEAPLRSRSPVQERMKTGCPGATARPSPRLAGGNYKVKCGENHEVLARLNGKMRQYRIRVISGDRVTVGVSPYDLKRGLITYRAK